ncbi:hypothetical protein U879_19875 [Defluviimonas sp. 20V17]|nr:hypothetical protein U879_19875 [Defluviimonas sp. 20V17]
MIARKGPEPREDAVPLAMIREVFITCAALRHIDSVPMRASVCISSF